LISIFSFSFSFLKKMDAGRGVGELLEKLCLQ
jgi:hypothetical protein